MIPGAQIPGELYTPLAEEIQKQMADKYVSTSPHLSSMCHLQCIMLQSQSLGRHHQVLAWKLPQPSRDRWSPGRLYVTSCW